MKAMDIVLKARDKKRPSGNEYINNIIDSFVECAGDRRYGEDRAIIGGFGYLKDMPVTVIALDKGSTTVEKIKRNFGSAHPEGYRKALRLMKQAEKFNRPIICLVDTSGAFCGIGAEERGQGQAIAENLMEMSMLKTPIISVIIGEGGSGGALGLSVSDEVWMMENAIYSVISPEGCASILYKDKSKVSDAAEALKLTAPHLLNLKIIEEIISEENDFFKNLKDKLYAKLSTLKLKDKETLINNRYDRFRKFL